MKQSKITGILFLLCIIIMIIFSLIKKEENRNIKESGLLGIFTIEDIYHAKNSYKITYSYDAQDA